MRLRVFLPAIDRPDASTRFGWMLFDSRRALLREDATPADAIPRVDDVEAVLPVARVLFARLKLPRVGRATLRELLPFAVEDRLLADPSHIHAVAGRRNARGETLVAVVDRTWLQSMLGVLGANGIRPRRAWCESALLAGGRGDWNAVWGRERGMLVDDEGVSVAFDRGPNADLPLALRIALDEGAARGERPAGIRVHTDDGEALPDLGRWSAECGVPCTPGNRWEALKAGAPAEGAIDLLQGELSTRPSILSSARVPRAALFLALAIGVLQLLFTSADALRLRGETAALEAQREAVFRAAFPEARVVVDPELQMARNLADLQRSRGLPSEDDFLVRVTRAARTSGEPVRSIEYVGGRLDVNRPATALSRAGGPR